jgi:hypothetical protein
MKGGQGRKPLDVPFDGRVRPHLRYRSRSRLGEATKPALLSHRCYETRLGPARKLEPWRGTPIPAALYGTSAPACRVPPFEILQISDISEDFRSAILSFIARVGEEPSADCRSEPRKIFGVDAIVTTIAILPSKSARIEVTFCMRKVSWWTCSVKGVRHGSNTRFKPRRLRRRLGGKVRTKRATKG